MPKLRIKGQVVIDFTTEVDIPEDEIDHYRGYDDSQLCQNFTDVENDGDLAGGEFDVQKITYDGKPFERKRPMPRDPILDGRY